MVSARTTRRRVVAVVGGIGATTSVLRRYATAVEDLTGLPTRVIATDYGLHDLASDIGAVFLVRAAPDRMHKAREMVVDLPVVTDQDTTAVALTASLLTSLQRAGRAPNLSPVVIAGANTMPMLSPLLMLAGIREVTTWNPADALAFPLRRIAARADAVINLVGGGGRYAWSRHGIPAVIVPDPARDPLLALPGLLLAVTGHTSAHPTLEVLLACAVALASTTTPGAPLPQRPDPALVRRVADAASQALHPAALPNERGENR